MAKGDDSRARNQIQAQGGLAQNTLNNVRDTIGGQTSQFWNNYTNATARDEANAAGIMGGYQKFADTGGFSANDLASIRARAIAPTRAVYQNAMQGVNRQRALQGGYSPNYTAAMSKMSRDLSSGLSDANTNAEAAIAQMVQSGKLAGLGGQAQLYGTTPGMSSMYGNQLLGSTGQQLQGQGLQNQLSLGIMQNQIDASRIPGRWENTVGRIGDVFDVAQRVGGGLAGGIYPWNKPGGAIKQTGPSTYGQLEGY